MARLECIVKETVELFMEYADDDGKLSKNKLKELFEKEIENPDIKAKLCTADCKVAMWKLDKDRDGGISINEFCSLIVFMSKCCFKKNKGECK